MEDANGRAVVAENGGALGKISALANWRQLLTLRGFFRQLGWTIGRYPLFYLVVCSVRKYSYKLSMEGVMLRNVSEDSM